MKITYENSVVQFNDLRAGDVFFLISDESSETLYIKLEDSIQFVNTGNGTYNAVCITGEFIGCFASADPNDPVHKVEVLEMKIKCV